MPDIIVKPPEGAGVPVPRETAARLGAAARLRAAADALAAAMADGSNLDLALAFEEFDRAWSHAWAVRLGRDS